MNTDTNTKKNSNKKSSSKNKTLKGISFVKSNNKVRLDILQVLNANAYVVYIQILSYRNTDTGRCFPSHNVIAKEINFSVSAVKRNIKLLEDCGFLIVNSGSFEKHLSNEYFFPKEDFFEMGYSESLAKRKVISEKNKKKLVDNFEGKNNNEVNNVNNKDVEEKEVKFERHIGFTKKNSADNGKIEKNESMIDTKIKNIIDTESIINVESVENTTNTTDDVKDFDW